MNEQLIERIWRRCKESLKHPFKRERCGQMKRRLVRYTLVVVLSSVALAYTHGARIRDNWHKQHWEDRIFFQYNHDIVHSWADCFLHRGLWSGLYRPLTTNLYYH